MPTFVTTGCVVGCCYSRGVYPVMARLPAEASAIRIGRSIRVRRVTGILGVSTRRLHGLGPRCHHSVVGNDREPVPMHLPRSLVKTFVSGGSSVFDCHTSRLLLGHSIMRIGSSRPDCDHSHDDHSHDDMSSSHDDQDGSSHGYHNGGNGDGGTEDGDMAVGDKSALSRVTTHGKAAIGGLGGLGGVSNGDVHTKGGVGIGWGGGVCVLVPAPEVINFDGASLVVLWVKKCDCK